jgi:hypothetical protein
MVACVQAWSVVAILEHATGNTTHFYSVIAIIAFVTSFGSAIGFMTILKAPLPGQELLLPLCFWCVVFGAGTAIARTLMSDTLLSE